MRSTKDMWQKRPKSSPFCTSCARPIRSLCCPFSCACEGVTVTDLALFLRYPFSLLCTPLHHPPLLRSALLSCPPLSLPTAIAHTPVCIFIGNFGQYKGGHTHFK
mmetsp:Transcript_45064/g.116522  ORF Transcript_45064/g.116522 Transcript_45064/m.116522 type:complete len:105 (-) Transcript_45064:573-887(-)